MNAVTETLDTAVDKIVPEQYQTTARELVNETGSGLKGVWNGIANKLEPTLGETGSKIASAAIMGIGSLLALKAGSALTSSLTSTFTGASSGLLNTIGGVAMAVGAGYLAINYMNGTGPFASPDNVAKNTITTPDGPPLG